MLEVKNFVKLSLKNHFWDKNKHTNLQELQNIGISNTTHFFKYILFSMDASLRTL